MFERVLSKQYKELDDGAKRRYLEKLNMIHLKSEDPYCVTGKCGAELVDFLPLVEYPDIFNYRISPIISRGFLQKNAIAKRGVRLTFEMRLTFEVFVKIVDRES